MGQNPSISSRSCLIMSKRDSVSRDRVKVNLIQENIKRLLKYEKEEVKKTYEKDVTIRS